MWYKRLFAIVFCLAGIALWSSTAMSYCVVDKAYGTHEYVSSGYEGENYRIEGIVHLNVHGIYALKDAVVTYRVIQSGGHGDAYRISVKTVSTDNYISLLLTPEDLQYKQPNNVEVEVKATFYNLWAIVLGAIVAIGSAIIFIINEVSNIVKAKSEAEFAVKEESVCNSEE